MNNAINLQDIFLNKARKEKIGITVFLINGYQIKGVVKAFDNYTILLISQDEQQLIYKHAVSTVIPISKVDIEIED